MTPKVRYTIINGLLYGQVDAGGWFVVNSPSTATDWRERLATGSGIAVAVAVGLRGQRGA